MKYAPRPTLNRYARLIAITLLMSVYLPFACARVIHPQGGPKDLTPPKLVSTYPIHASTMFKGRKIILTFDKEVDQKGLYTKLKISPNIKQEDSRGYTYKTKGKTIEIELERELEDDKTYTFNFDDCIVDTTEGNPADNLILTFSTGPTIDEMKAEGIVLDTLTNVPISNAHVFLYTLEDDIPFEEQNKILTEDPTYFTKTDKSGRFTLANLKEGNYKVYAKYNAEADLFNFNPSQDHCGIVPYPVYLKQDNADDFLIIKIVKADLSELKVTKTTPRGPHFEIKFNKPITEYSFDELNLCTNLSEDKKSIYIFNTQKDRTSGETIVQTNLIARDNIGESIEQEATIILNSNNENHIKTHFTISPSPNSNLSTNPSIEIKSQKPILSLEQVDKNGIFLYLNEKLLFLSEDNLSLNLSENKITISYDLSSEELNFEEELNLYLAIAPGAIKDIDDGAIGSTTYPYKIANPKKFGSISGNVYLDSAGGDYMIQLVGLDRKVASEIYSYEVVDGNYKFKLIQPGKYLLRILSFNSGSRYWSPGNILKNKAPDKVEIYTNLVETLENWEVDGIDFYLS